MQPAARPLPGTEPGAGALPVKKIWRFLRWIFIAAVILAVVQAVSVVSKPTVSFGDATIDVEVVQSQNELVTGLGGRQSLGPDEGMLFIFGTDDYQPIWMKDMNFAIDIIWLNADKKVVTVHKNVDPSTFPDAFIATEPARYVLEVPAGAADAKGIEVGDQADFNL